MTAINGSSEYATTTAFRRALEDRLKARSKETGRPLEELRREFLFQRFLALVFQYPGSAWILKGGAGLLMRLPEARFSKDLDLYRSGGLDAAEAMAELRELTVPRDGDHLEFTVDGPVASGQDNRLAQARITAYIGSMYGAFPVDLALDLKLVATLETVRPDPVVDVPGLGPIPEFVLYPLADQVADKVCAMYELHGRQAAVSTRYRDLIDLALIVTTSSLDARHLRSALKLERERRRIELPAKLEQPGPNWMAGYAAIARREKAARKFRDIGTALALVSACLSPVLSGERTSGKWHPTDGWADR
ncbi:nucleotidyl transferase AbiEii/AbiGii toxin family protein [Arthrobacter sp. MI7-26]|uniref:nucleotidyl transferase AbiEii/AbiGii toxin family protein n=1 Tax=Arthrobacter sp. MI7-26 TaxID=2993653 RepID=UPI002248B3D5|nr:nucleotidyl transferase AbiEii/AbiGii toxin family protein [Arthrobacter sp. MI7-26]MCX2747797.1 nucleotidyl transferase AbiEii/AbiGii toxin family protein [Arthrobacter sp. MI7-26]